MNTNVLIVKDLIVAYGKKVAVNGVSFDVRPGEIFGLLGPNGAGKTSTLSVIEGLIKPVSGSAAVAGFDVFKNALEAKSNLGLQLQFTSFQQDLNLREIVQLYSALYGQKLSNEEADTRLKEAGLGEDTQTRANRLSGGQQQRLSLLIAIVHNPPLVLLDEPTSGLDPQSRRALWERMDAMRDSGRSILLTTHSMEEARAVCDRVAIMDHGRLIVIDDPRALIEKYKNDPDVQALSRHGEVTLEDVFIALTGREVRE